MEYIEEGDLRNFLKSKITLQLADKLKKLIEIAIGLQEIHDKGLIHKDLHSGNILKKANSCFLTDLGQCEQEAEQLDNKQSFFGLLPYVAPEVLQGGKYTSKADIYSFGIIMIEMINQLPPHCYEDWNGSQLITKIINGFRPEIHFQVPKFFKDLIDKCLDNDPNQRPSAFQIKEVIENWLDKNKKEETINKIKQNTPFYQQYQECEKSNGKIKLDSFRKKTFHPSTHYHSKLIETSKWIVTTSKRITETQERRIDTAEQLQQDLKRSLSILETNTENKKPKGNHKKPFSLSERLGAGAFGTVYSGEWNNQQVAIKKINTTFNSLKDIKKELKISKLQHENIICFLEAYQSSQNVFIIMELANGGSLTDYVNQNKNWDVNYNFILNMTIGLKYLHGKKIVHCDLKSMNILINNNIVKLADFGLAKVKTFQTGKTPSNVVGTTRWMAPEILLHNQPHTYQSDIYSLGMIFWEIVAKCTTPFKNNEERFIANIYNHREREIIPNDAPPVLKEIITDCWQEIPEQRISLAQISTKINEASEIDKAPLPPISTVSLSDNVSLQLQEFKKISINDLLNEENNEDDYQSEEWQTFIESNPYDKN